MADLLNSPVLNQIQVVYEDEHLLAINKPAGVVVNEAKTVTEATIQGWMRHRLGEEQGIATIIKNRQQWQTLVPTDFSDEYGTPEEIFQLRQGIVHRLDKDTSGVLLLAKDPGTLVNLLAQFKNRQTRKKYLCLVHGKFKVELSSIDLPIVRSNLNRAKFAVAIDGKSALTYYRVVDYFSHIDETQLKQTNQKIKLKDLRRYQQGFSLLECLPKTGRTHQIRVHLAHIKHPLVADTVYGGEKRSQLDKTWCPRQFLHAAELQYCSPQTGTKQVAKAELAQDLLDALKLLKK